MKHLKTMLVASAGLAVSIVSVSQAVPVTQPRSVGPTRSGTQPKNQAFTPGMIHLIPLTDFLPPHLHPAVAALKKGDFAAARQAFGAEIQARPDNLAAQVGYLQASRDSWDELQQTYEQAVEKNDTAANRFRLGWLAAYRYRDGLGVREFIPSSEFIRPMAELKPVMGNRERVHPRIYLMLLSETNLWAAWKRTASPVAGFEFFDSIRLPAMFGMNSGVPQDAQSSVIEQLLRQSAGKSGYAAYLHARDHKWKGPLPTVPDDLSREKLATLRWAVQIIRSRLGHVAHGPRRDQAGNETQIPAD